MRGKDWSYLLRKIPVEFHSEITLATVTGAEVIVKGIIRLDDDYLVILGRPAGTNDEGKVLIVPFEQINYLMFRRTLSEEEIDYLFGNGDQEGFASMPSRMKKANKPQPEPEEEDSHTQNGTGMDIEEEEEAPTGPSNASKSMLLARIRERLATDSSKPKR